MFCRQAWSGAVADFETHGVVVQISWLHPVDSLTCCLDEHDGGGGRFAQIRERNRVGTREQRVLPHDHEVVGVPAVWGLP